MLYDLDVELMEKGEVIDRVTRRIGLRTIELDRHPDQYGESFQFKCNGVVFFAKGANWIPDHSFVSEVKQQDYEDRLTSAVQAHMNMLRVWGGGIYEMDTFYDLCDEKGLLVWQDFMFACALYPGDAHFCGLVQEEAVYQVKRLSHRACLALWCGNNELELRPNDIIGHRQRKKAYETVFYRLLPDIVKKYDGVTPYWPSSPHNPEGYDRGPNNENMGDCHFWEVWHARKPVKTYETKKFRFCSEFGMQSYSSPDLVDTFCPKEEQNVFSPIFENHQKHGAGNLIIFDYISRLYRFPKDYSALSYLSQLNQAYCMKIGVEHFRRSMPRTMGALYWQINDCWPVASWSSLEFGGNWKALHYEARRFFAPFLVSAYVPGDETIVKNSANLVVSTIDEVHLYTVSDERLTHQGTLSWRLCHLDGRVLREGSKAITLRYSQSVLQQKLRFGEDMARHKAANLYLRLWLEVEGITVSEQTVFLTAPRNLHLLCEKVKVNVKMIKECEVELSFIIDVFLY